MKDIMEISPEVEKALNDSKPVVALESTIISHGMPYPTNLKTAISLENEIRSHDAIPATIAVIGGKIKIGLSNLELEYMAKAKNVLKLSRMDLPYAVSKKLDGATTVAATMMCAKMAGIKVFATGGVGGVHRGVNETFDISTDLFELSKTPVIVVSAGVKSILDIPKTLEILETLGVTVVGYKTYDFPSFYSRDSGSKLYMKVDTPKEVANLYNTKIKMEIESGILVANPISKEYEIPNDVIDKAINKALEIAKENKISGKAMTPFLLSKIVEQIPEALESNIHLAKSNAALAAEITKNL